MGFALGGLVRRAIVALSLGIGAWIALDVGRGVAEWFRHESALLSTYLPSPLGNRSYVDYYVKAVQAAGDAVFDYTDSMVRVPLAWAAIGAAIGCVMLMRREVR